MTIVSYYAPKRNPISFLSHLLSVVSSNITGTLLICGDSGDIPFLRQMSNLAKCSTPLLSATPEPIYSTKKNPTRRQYTHYSHPHKQFSRMNNIIVKIRTSPLVLTSTIAPCLWSYHNAVITSFSSLVPRPNHHFWTINDSLLANPTHCQDLEDYITKNCASEVSPLTL